MTENTLAQASQPKVPAYLPVIVALNDAAFDVLSWPIRSVITRLRGRITEEIEMNNNFTIVDDKYILDLRSRITALGLAYQAESMSRNDLSKRLRSLASLVFEGRPLG